MARRRRLPDLPAQLRRRRRRRDRGPARDHRPRRPPRRPRRRRRLALAGAPVPAGRQRLRHLRLPGRRPALRDARRPRRPDRRAPRPRHEAADGPRRQPHVRRAPVVPGVRDPHDEHRDWYWWRPPRDGTTAGEPGAEPTNWRSFFSGPAWELDPASGEYYLHLFSRKQPDLNWEQPAVRQAVYSMMRWWLDRGVDGFRMDVVNMLSKDPSLPDGPPIGDGRLGDRRGGHRGAPAPRVPPRDARRRVHRPRGPALTVGEMPGVTIDEAVRFTTRRGEARHGLPVRARRPRPRRRQVAPRSLDLRDLKASLGRWQTGLAATGWNSLYFCNHDQPRSVSRWATTAPSTASARPRCWPRSSTCTAGRRTSTRARSSA